MLATTATCVAGVAFVVCELARRLTNTVVVNASPRLLGETMALTDVGVVALHVGKFFPNNLTLMVQGDSDVVSDVIESIYARGDRLFLAGHSFGGRVIGEVMRELNKKSIPVEMVAYIESFWSSGLIPANVRHAFNFHVPVSLALCPGLSTIKAEDDRETRLTNIAVPEPVGPYSGFCAEHRNIDSDPRVWKPLVEFLRERAASEPW